MGIVFCLKGKTADIEVIALGVGKMYKNSKAIRFIII